MAEAMRKVVGQIFNNWTALQLAVEHSMGGPSSKKAAFESLEYIVHFCVNEVQRVDEIKEALEDIMDQEFDTICQDGSIEEISAILFKFIQLIRNNQLEQFNEEYTKLPVAEQWLIKPQTIKSSNLNEAEETGSSSTSEPMDESEWMEVKSKRRK